MYVYMYIFNPKKFTFSAGDQPIRLIRGYDFDAVFVFCMLPDLAMSPWQTESNCRVRKCISSLAHKIRSRCTHHSSARSCQRLLSSLPSWLIVVEEQPLRNTGVVHSNNVGGIVALLSHHKLRNICRVTYPSDVVICVNKAPLVFFSLEAIFNHFSKRWRITWADFSSLGCS